MSNTDQTSQVNDVDSDSDDEYDDDGSSSTNTTNTTTKTKNTPDDVGSCVMDTIKNINEELDFSFLKLADQDLYNEIIKIKNGEFCNRYLHLDVNNHNFGIEFKV